MEKTYLDYDVAENAVEAEKNLNSGQNENENGRKNAFDIKNYLNLRLSKEEKSKTITIRLLPFPDTRTPFLHIHMHTTNVHEKIADSGRKAYICLEKTEGLDKERFGSKCPFCEIAKKSYKDAKEEKDPEKREILRNRGKQYLSDEYVIMRCIERGKEDEGVKFVKVKVHQSKKDDIYSQICTLAEVRKNAWLSKKSNEGKDTRESNILSINDYGYDLMITVTKAVEYDKYGNKTEKMTYQVTDDRDPSPLSEDQEQAKAWVYDEKKWYEVFVPKPYDYLAIVMQGKLPWYDRAIGKWVSKEENDAKKAEEESVANANIQEAERKAIQAMYTPGTSAGEDNGVPQQPESVKRQLMEEPDKVSGNTPEDDLPF